ncbi:MAG: hypothetical protein GXY34_02990 [Syntrophomonadaceae bacterium]|nr:hypothetical protein [Syntrophomonadaceae bacterium]
MPADSPAECGMHLYVRNAKEPGKGTPGTPGSCPACQAGARRSYNKP